MTHLVGNDAYEADGAAGGRIHRVAQPSYPPSLERHQIANQYHNNACWYAVRWLFAVTEPCADFFPFRQQRMVAYGFPSPISIRLVFALCNDDEHPLPSWLIVFSRGLEMLCAVI